MANNDSPTLLFTITLIDSKGWCRRFKTSDESGYPQVTGCTTPAAIVSRRRADAASKQTYPSWSRRVVDEAVPAGADVAPINAAARTIVSDGTNPS